MKKARFDICNAIIFSMLFCLWISSFKWLFIYV